MKNKILLSAALLVALGSCSENNLQDPAPKTNQEQVYTPDAKDLLKADFGRAFSKALVQSQSLRQLVKAEALKMFNNDYDVLYSAIKDESVENGLTVRELLLQFEAASKMEKIETSLPLLTIFVPELPEETFSAKNWDAGQVIPAVGVTSASSNDVLMIGHETEEYMLESWKIPAFPVVVIKDNERIIPITSKSRAQARGSAFRAGDMEYVFLADCFDGSIETKEIKAEQDENGRFVRNPDSKLIEAYNIYKNVDGWHRDYIYYNIQPSQDRGAFSYDFQEHITSFSLKGDPASVYSKISDQTGDPKLKISTKANSGWTGGFFEFKVRALINAKNGIGEELVTYFSALPTDLFTVEYERKLFYYIPKITGLRAKALNLPLFAWDLNDYASTIKIEVEEVDLTETIVNQETRTVKFATNFSIEGTLKKIGLKFGASLEETRSQTISRTYTVGNDLLGSVIVNFADDVILQPIDMIFLNGWITREYSTGWYGVSVEPKRVQ